MMLYIIGPMTFQMIVIGLIFETLGIKYESITNQGQQEQDQSRQASAQTLLNRGDGDASSKSYSG